MPLSHSKEKENYIWIRRIMRHNLLAYCFLSILWYSCSPEEEQLISSAKDPIDNGVYTNDVNATNTFCDFVLESNSKNCWDNSVDVYQDCHLNLLFTRYGNGWTGGDATYSTPLPDGRVIWMFGDTFLGQVSAERTRSGAPFIRNTFMVQDGDEMVTLNAFENGEPTALLKPENKEQWYWPLDGTIHNNEFQIMLARMGHLSSNGIWSFAYNAFDLAVFSLPDLRLKFIEERFPNPDISYGATLMEDGGYTYIYGISQIGFQKFAHVARVEGGDLKMPWTYYNGTDWQDEPSKYIIAKDVIDQFAVFKEGNIYYLVTQETGLKDRIFIRNSNSPTGPWQNKKYLYCTPESGGNIITYNAFVHPQLSSQDYLTISYNINSLDFQDIFGNADYYRPKFVRVENWK